MKLFHRPSRITLQAVMRDAWTDERVDDRARYARLWPTEEHGRWVFYRAQGDVIRFAQVALEPPSAESTAAGIVTALDMDIADALDTFAAHPLSVSEALEAGERRRVTLR